MPKKSKSNAVYVSWDYKRGDEAFDEIKKELPKLGLFVYPSPGCEGSDAFGFVISKVELTDEQVEEIDNN